MKALFLVVRKLWPMLKFFKSMSVKGLVTRKTHMQYESPINCGKKIMAKVKVFQKQVKLQGQGHKIKNYGTK